MKFKQPREKDFRDAYAQNAQKTRDLFHLFDAFRQQNVKVIAFLNCLNKNGKNSQFLIFS